LLRSRSQDGHTALRIGALQRAEVVLFMKPGEEAATRAFLSRFRTEPVTQGIVDRGADIYRRWHRSHGVDVNDAILAATVATTGGTVRTQNLEHFPIPDASVVKGW
jgi:predicted nucleic acid-binding protein